MFKFLVLLFIVKLYARSNVFNLLKYFAENWIQYLSL